MNEKIRNALAFYANPDNYEGYEKDYGDGRPAWRGPAVVRDGGLLARTVLECDVPPVQPTTGEKNDR